MSKKVTITAITLGLCVAGTVLVYNSDSMKNARAVKTLVERNMDARGGSQAWKKVSALKMTGRMDIGQGMSVPYILEQKRPGKMCFGFVFNNQTALQCSDGKTGWKIAPFRGVSTAEPMTELELREIADTSDPYGLLYNYSSRDIDIEMLGHVKVDDTDAVKLKLTLPKGGVRWLYLDAKTALELKMETIRTVAGREHKVETVYSDWRKTDGLLIAHRQDTKTVGDAKAHFLTVESISVNPYIADSRFAMPVSSGATRPVAGRRTPYDR